MVNFCLLLRAVSERENKKTPAPDSFQFQQSFQRTMQKHEHPVFPIRAH